jgi:agmatinase
MKLQYAACDSIERATTVLLGADTRGAGFSESARGSSEGPRALRTPGFVREADNQSPSLCECLSDGARLHDAGDLSLDGLAPAAQVERTRRSIREVLARGQRFIALGGDHLLKYAALQAVSDSFSDCGVVYLDAHPDCADGELGYASILHHAWALPGIAPARTSVLGVRQVNPAERAGLQRWKPGVVWGQDFFRLTPSALLDKVLGQLGNARRWYLSIDLDGLAPQEVPAVEAPYPGGPLLRELLGLIEEVSARLPLVGADLTEFLPEYDSAKLTALTAARLIKETHCAMSR